MREYFAQFSGDQNEQSELLELETIRPFDTKGDELKAWVDHGAVIVIWGKPDHPHMKRITPEQFRRVVNFALLESLK